MRRVGRPSKINKNQVIETLLTYKDTIINTENYKVRSKVDSIWNRISSDINHIMSPNALYTFVSCNKFGVRDILCERTQMTSCDNEENTCHDDDYNDDDNNGENISVAERREDVTSTSEQMLDSMVSESIASNIGGISQFVITIPKKDFIALIITKIYQRTDKHRPKSTREYTVLKPGLWQHFFNEKIWQATKISCGFNFKRHKLSKTAEFGYARGTCKCGSVIKLKINNSDECLTKLECTYLEGQGRCGKRYLRNPIRQDVAEKLKSTTAAKYRIEMAEKLIDENDKTEPPHLYSVNVLKVAKHEIMQKSYFDKDVIKALHLMMLGPLQHVIHNLGLSPFFVFYWTNHQSHVYRTYASDETACIYIDATGSIVRKIKNPDNTKTKHIFLYNCVANSEKSGLFPVCQMLSEKHSTVAIHSWLMEWSESGVPHPREIVCDASRALLTAAVRNFTGFRTIEQYCNACKENIMPSCYIRIDVAHFIKLYANVLKNVRPRLKTFYLSLLGQLILCCNISDAEEILRAIFVIARSETEGLDRNNKKTICEIYKIKMKNLITSANEEVFINKDISFTEEELANSDDIDIEQQLKTTIEDNNDYEWNKWAKAINNEVQRNIADNEGDRENAHYLPTFADRLMKNIQLIPMWSCICWDKFGYGRIPASSASVESDFNIIKNVLLKTEQTPMRADEFVMKHYNFISGRLKITNIDISEKDKERNTKDTEEARHIIESMECDIETCDIETSNRVDSDQINNDFISEIQINNEDV